MGMTKSVVIYGKERALLPFLVLTVLSFRMFKNFFHKKWKEKRANHSDFRTKLARMLYNFEKVRMINDMYAENSNDDCEYAQFVSQKDFDAF